MASLTSTPVRRRRPLAPARFTSAPLPLTIDPMLATSGSLPADDQHFAFEYKWDGVRTIAFVDRGQLRLQTRNLIDATHRYPELQQLASAFEDRSVILDGEIIALDEVDRPSFARLQKRMHLTDRAAIAKAVTSTPIFFVIFDLLHLDGRSLLHEPYVARREMLEELTLAGASWQVTSSQVGGGAKMLAAAKTLGLEGVVAKRLSSLYEPGRRSPAWIKAKIVQSQEFVIGGWQEQVDQPNRIGALLIGYYEPSKRASERGLKFRYAGRVGSGFGASTHAELSKQLRSIASELNPFSERPPRSATPVHFVEPKLIAEIEFRGWTEATILRQPAFKGLRDDKETREVVRE